MKVNSIKLAVEMSRQKLSVKKLSEMSYVSRNTISAIRNGKSCNSVTAGKIADALGVDVTELLED